MNFTCTWRPRRVLRLTCLRYPLCRGGRPGADLTSAPRGTWHVPLVSRHFLCSEMIPLVDPCLLSSPLQAKPANQPGSPSTRDFRLPPGSGAGADVRAGRGHTAAGWAPRRWRMKGDSCDENTDGRVVAAKRETASGASEPAAWGAWKGACRCQRERGPPSPWVYLSGLRTTRQSFPLGSAEPLCASLSASVQRMSRWQ